MKKALSIVVCLAIVFALTGCGGPSVVPDSNNGGENVIVDNRNEGTVTNQEEQNTQKENVTVTDEDFSIVGYPYEDSFSSMYFLVVTNNSKGTVEFSANGIARDANGGMIGADELSIDVLGPGETSIGYFYFSDVKDVASVDYTFEYDTSSYYYPVISNLSIEQTLNDRNVTVKVTNNGNSCAEFVEAHALFFDSSNNVISHTSNYVVDNDSEIKPGKSISTQLDSYESYDHVEVYFTGRSTGKTVDPNAVSAVSDSILKLPNTCMRTPILRSIIWLLRVMLAFLLALQQMRQQKMQMVPSWVLILWKSTFLVLAKLALGTFILMMLKVLRRLNMNCLIIQSRIILPSLEI